jgi:formylglycine-generating enzyme
MNENSRPLTLKHVVYTAVAMVIVAIASAGRGAIIISTVAIGNVGNPADTRVMNDGSSGYGQVYYAYNFGKYEVTAAQYTAFLNAVGATDTYGLYNTAMTTDPAGCQIIRSGTSGSYTYSVSSDYANRPVNHVSWGDAARFCNWLANGQPTGTEMSGTTETGSYTLNGALTAAALLSVTRNTSATWFVPTENEWYKAAFYNPTTGAYYGYATSSNTLPSNVLANPDPGNSANFLDSQDNFTIGNPYYRTTVGAFAHSSSPYGTFDQNGNVWEWNESTIYDSFMGLRGGSLNDYDVTLSASFRYFDSPDFESDTIGFRVASAVPEPSSGNYWAPGATGGQGAATDHWSAAAAKWATRTGVQGSRTQAVTGALVFADLAGDVLVDGPVTATAGLTFLSDGYVLKPGLSTPSAPKIILAGGTAALNAITVDSGKTATINVVLDGSNGMTKLGDGTLVLGGANTYTGGTIVAGGTLEIGASSALPAGRPLMIGSGGTVVLSSGMSGIEMASAAVPEPGTVSLLIAAGLGIFVLCLATRCHRNAASSGIK